MNEQELDIEKSLLNDWIDEETRHIDVVASWENMCAAYDSLRFSDPISDIQRLEEFKWIVHQMNVFLSRTRTKLMTCKNSEAMSEILGNAMNPSGKVELNDRKSLAFQKLRQQWIMTMLSKLSMMTEADEPERVI